MNRLLERTWLPVWNADGGAGGGGGATAGSDGGAGGGDKQTLAGAAAAVLKEGDGKGNNRAGAGDGKAGGEDGGKGAPQPYHPQGLPEAYRGKTDSETIDKLLADITGRPKPPEKPDGYELKLDTKLAERFGDMKNDKVLPLWREVAHELGLSQEQFNGAFARLYAKMAEANLIDDPVSVANELKQLEPASGDPKQRQAAAAQRVQAAVDWVNGLVTRNVMSAELAAEVVKIAETARGVMAIEALIKGIASSPGLVGGGEPVNGADQMTAHEKAMRAMFPSAFQQ